MRVIEPPTIPVEALPGDIVRPVALAIDDVVVRTHVAALDQALEAAADALRVGDDADRAGAIAAVRAMYRRVGLDPTRTRPSSEALLRRVRRGDPLPRVNSLVDVVNWCSVEVQLPFGLYDRDAIDGSVALRLGAEGEQYAGIRKDVVHVGGRLALADAKGPFGNPTSDSARTAVTIRTTRALVVVFAPAALPIAAAARAIALTAARSAEYCAT